MNDCPQKLLFFIDRIEHSSYPVTETGYALVYRAWMRALSNCSEVYVAYPDSDWHESAAGELYVRAHRVLSFSAAPYAFYRSQRESYRADADVGSSRCHAELPAAALLVNALDAAIWRQETGDPARSMLLLRALSRVERDTTVYLSPALALEPRFGSKVLPRTFDERLTPRTWFTEAADKSPEDKIAGAMRFVHELGRPETLIVKPLYGNNGVGIHVLGRDPRSGQSAHGPLDRRVWSELLARYGELVVQEYVPSVRAPGDISADGLSVVPVDRHDFGEVRFLLIDGELPRGVDGRPCVFARRVPVADSLVADSGISHPTTLSRAELAFLERLGPAYRRWGIYFGGGDVIRTPDPARPFVFTDAARSVCGHAVVTGALNGAPYLIVDQILDSLERHIARRYETLVDRGHALAPGHA